MGNRPFVRRSTREASGFEKAFTTEAHFAQLSQAELRLGKSGSYRLTNAVAWFAIQFYVEFSQVWRRPLATLEREPPMVQLLEHNAARLSTRRHLPRTGRFFEPLESRTLLSSTLFVSGLGVPLDGTHFHSLQSALVVAQAGDTIHLQSGYAGDAETTSPLVIDKGITLSADSGVTLPVNLEIGAGVSGVVLSHIAGANLTFNAGSFGNSVNDSSFGQVLLQGGTHHNTFTHNTIGQLTALGGDDASGHDAFVNNTFTGMVTISGNPSADTADSFTGNTFTVSNGDALTLDGASGTTVSGNIITDSSPFASGILVRNADDVVLLNNTITTTGMNGTGIYIYSDGTSSTSVDVRGNSSKTGSGYGLYIAKYDTTALLEVRVQGNDLRGNAIGAFVFGDGATAGNVDLGGGTTRFGTSTGENDFSTYTAADAGRYAIGLFATDPGEVLVANNNHFGVADPLTVVADGAHNQAAFGTGVVLGTQYVAPAVSETLAAVASTLSGIETGIVSGVVAHFTSSIAHAAGDFTVTLAWGDGTTSAGIVIANAAGGFDVLASHAWDEAGNYGVTVSISSGNASATAHGSAAIEARVIGVIGNSFSSVARQTFNGVVATFTDNLLGTLVSSYNASIAWSDGQVTKGTVVKNADGSFSIKTHRSFSKSGVVLASVSIGTADGLFFGTTSLTATITDAPSSSKCNGKSLKQLVSYLKRSIQCHSYSHGKPAFAKAHCHR
jgi:hypothetical protein